MKQPFPVYKILKLPLFTILNRFEMRGDINIYGKHQIRLQYVLLLIAFIKHIYIKHVLNTVINIISRGKIIKYLIYCYYSNTNIEEPHLDNLIYCY